jgi:HD-GYP domain-containing protein (c-di-GMP phosphodiesterase class II)
VSNNLKPPAKTGSANEVVAAGEIRIGMYVAELDRPWLGTPFLLQGFLVENEEQITQLRQYCATVVIDRSRSIGDQHVERPRERPVPRKGTAAGVTGRTTISAVPAKAIDFFSVARRVRERSAVSKRGSPPPAGVESPLETELLYSATVVDDVHRTLEAIHGAKDGAGHFDLDRVCDLVEEMAGGVERNPDAMLWLTRLKITDQYSYDHAVDVSVHLMVYGRFLGFSRHAVEELGQAGLMQDVGKSQLNPEILGKPSALTEEEYAKVQSHVVSSLELLNRHHAFSPAVMSIIAAHHERHDGSGYPRKLDGKRISLHAELAGLIDTYCAITRHRVFSAAVSHQKALEILSRMRGTKFREVLVDQFVQCLGLYPIGTLVELNTGEVAVVVQQNQVRRMKPRVLILLSSNKTVERRARSLDLILDPATPTGDIYRITQALPSDAFGIDPAEFFLDL